MAREMILSNRRAKEPVMKNSSKRVVSILAAIGVVLFGVGVAFAFALSDTKHYRMPNAAMEPTIETGATVRADLSAYDSEAPQRWDLVVFDSPGPAERNWIFRVVGMPGETVAFDDDGLLVDGVRIDTPEHLADINYTAAADGTESIVVPDQSYYVLGDNAEKANDSRFWGTVNSNAIIGQVIE